MGTRSEAWPIAALVLTACAPPTALHVAPVIYGEDDRVEIVDDEHEVLAARGRASVVALVDRDRLAACDGGPVRWYAPTLGAYRNVCDGERFVDQPVLAECSGTLVDRDLVLTARHCLPDTEACARVRLVAGLHLDAAGTLRPVGRGDVYACRAMIEVEARDLVWVVLDRPAPFEPASLGTAEVGEPLHVIGFPTGLPMKSAHGCSVRDHYVPSDLYRMDCDLFAGSSGSGVFDADGALLGVYTQGAGDYVPRAPGECVVPLRFDQDGRLLGGSGTPQLGAFQPVTSAVASLCASGRPTVLCDRPARCGDGVCSLGEREALCADCLSDACGDGICSPGEDFACAIDCGDRDRATACGTDAGADPDAGSDARLADGGPRPAPSCAARPSLGGGPISLAVLAMMRLTRRRR